MTSIPRFLSDMKNDVRMTSARQTFIAQLGLYLFLGTHITGPRHHLASSISEDVPLRGTSNLDVCRREYCLFMTNMTKLCPLMVVMRCACVVAFHKNLEFPIT